MIKKAVAAMMLVAFASMAFAQQTLHVSVLDPQNRPLRGASVRLPGTLYAAQTDAQGQAEIGNLRANEYLVEVSYLGYATQRQSVSLATSNQLAFELVPTTLLAEEVIVRATRASENTATTYKNISKEEIAKSNLGQDLPFLLDQTPSMVITSDAGAGVGYTGMRIRGSDATRVNITINGIPFNDSESMGAFLVNMPDFASSVDNVQIQRGVGTSTNGASAFGASINIQTTTLNEAPYAEIDNSIGSYKTMKNTIRVGTGLIDDRFSFDGRLSRIVSDGYIDRASADMHSFFLSGAWHGKNSLLRANIINGKEKTYQAWYGTPEARLTGDVEGMLAYAADDGLTAEETENLLNSDRRYNKYLYEDETDNYHQTHYHLLFSSTLDSRWSLNTALHYTRGAGYYTQFRANDRYSRYGLEPVELNGQTIDRTDLVRNRWLDNHFYGGTYSLSYQNRGLNVVWGGAYNRYEGGHFGDITWAQYPLFVPAQYRANMDGSFSELYRYYDNDAVKTDFNTYLKADYQFDDLLVFADVQYRHIGYDIAGVDNNQWLLDQSTKFDFINPKLGLTYQLSSASNVYASFAVANKEPVRSDFTDWPTDQAPKAERLHNVEAGYRIRAQAFNIGVNGFAMLYKNQLVLTGQLNDVGAALRRNVENSYRLGVELDGRWRPIEPLTWSATFAFSENKIKDFVEVVGDRENHYARTDISFSPRVVASSELSYTPWESVELALVSKYVSRQFLDNTGNAGRSIDAFFVNNLRLAYNTPIGKLKNVGVTLLINNLFNEKYSANGYTWGYYLSDTDRVDYNFYYPQAETNFMLGLNVKF